MWVRIRVLCLSILLCACSGQTSDDGGEPAASTPDVALADSSEWGDVTPLVDSSETPSDADVASEVHQEPVVVTGLKVTPQSTLAIQVEQGTSQSLGLGAALVYSDGEEVPVAPSEVIWTFSDSSIATTDEDNVPMATGLTGGQVLIVAIHAGLHAQCSVTVQLLVPDPVIVDGMSAEEVALFDSGVWQDDPGSPSVVYPLDGSVIPRGMKPPVFQWQAGLSKYFKLVLTGAQGFSITLYTLSLIHI